MHGMRTAIAAGSLAAFAAEFEGGQSLGDIGPL